ncbi:MAG: hypothetical protein BM557_01110 [Flavobacterium sp. MedPE-SWcel]|uniref:hypothetical protein n=1 Tax=uncultured Flavobacterium sp. TaxID=165435 RepID=UPI00091D206E|nr:hypothetical protein [uncultured Flavobacterium sp.]OIQ22006.1 MAG: hypothetical protein BM557_01110 [Flavobacterium sp. MedPE-SWcel]
MKNNISNYHKIDYKPAIIITIIIIITCFIWGTLVLLPPIIPYYDFTNTGQLGDTIGGLTSPIIGIGGAFLVYVSFQAQLKANKMQWEAFNKEIHNQNADRFYNKNYESIKEFKSNLNNIEFSCPTPDNKTNIVSNQYINYKGFDSISIVSAIISDQNKSQTENISISTYLSKLSLIFLDLDLTIMSINKNKDLYTDECKELKEIIAYIKRYHLNLYFHNLLEELEDDNSFKEYISKIYSSIENWVAN